ARPRPPATPADLASLHGQLDLIAAGETADGAKLRSENAVDDFRQLVVIAAAAGRADDQLTVEDLLECCDSTLAPRRADRNLVVGAAEPVEFRRLDDPSRLAEQRIERDAARERADGGAVLRGDLIEPVRQREACRTDHLTGNKGWISRDMPAHETREEARVDVVDAADAEPDINVDALVLVEIRNRRLSAGGRGGDRARR